MEKVFGMVFKAPASMSRDPKLELFTVREAARALKGFGYAPENRNGPTFRKLVDGEEYSVTLVPGTPVAEKVAFAMKTGGWK